MSCAPPSRHTYNCPKKTSPVNPVIHNLFANIPETPDREVSLTLAQMGHARVERIVSNGQASPPEFWYDQPEDEWVMLIQGTASLQFADGDPVQLNAGDNLLIPSHVKHRVTATSADAVWLAVHGR